MNNLFTYYTERDEKSDHIQDEKFYELEMLKFDLAKTQFKNVELVTLNCTNNTSMS